MSFRRFRPGFLRWATATTAVAALLACTSAASNRAVSTPQGYGRIWFYRVYEPSISRNDANVDLDDRRVASLLPWGSYLYRDVLPGAHRVTVENSVTPNDSKDLLVALGQEVFAKIVVLDNFLSGGGTAGVHREVFFVRPVAQSQARGEMAISPMAIQP